MRLRDLSCHLLLALASLASPTQLPASEATPSPSSGLGFLKPFVGVWVPHPDWKPLRERPELHTLVPLNLKWGNEGSFLEVAEGLLEDGAYSTSGIVVWNPATETADFLAKQVGGDLVFDGYYESLGATKARRVYDVIRPGGTVDTYRETFELSSDGVLAWTTEKNENGVFEPVSGRPGPEFHAIRPASDESAERLAELEELVGRWRPDPGGSANRRDVDALEDVQVSFEWGAGRAWIEVAAHRRREGAWRSESSGLVGWDPARRQVVYREHLHDGVSVDGSIELVEPGVFRRHYRSSHPDGSIRRWHETWTWHEGPSACFEVTTVELVGDSEVAQEPYRTCRVEG